MNQPMNQSINQAISLSDHQNNTAMFHSSRNSIKHADAILRHMSQMCFFLITRLSLGSIRKGVDVSFHKRLIKDVPKTC